MKPSVGLSESIVYTCSDVNVARLNFSEFVFGDASVGLGVNRLVVILGTKRRQNQVPVRKNLQYDRNILIKRHREFLIASFRKTSDVISDGLKLHFHLLLLRLISVSQKKHTSLVAISGISLLLKCVL